MEIIIKNNLRQKSLKPTVICMGNPGECVLSVVCTVYVQCPYSDLKCENHAMFCMLS